MNKIKKIQQELFERNPKENFKNVPENLEDLLFDTKIIKRAKKKEYYKNKYK